VRRTFHIEKEQAVQVIDVTAGSPAERAGIHPGDIIYKLDDKPVATVDDIRHYLERLNDGTRVRVALIRPTDNGPQALEMPVVVQVASAVRQTR
jgi:S1-C subfamily serine protease